MDLVSVYRDAIAVATGAPGQLVNEEIRGDVELLARVSTPEANLRRIAAIFEAREQMLEFNVPPMLALESMMLALVAPEVRSGMRRGRSSSLVVASSSRCWSASAGSPCSSRPRPATARRTAGSRAPTSATPDAGRDRAAERRRWRRFYAQQLTWSPCRDRRPVRDPHRPARLPPPRPARPSTSRC